MGRVRWQFENVAEHNNWMHSEKATCPITAFNESATHILHGVPTSVTHNELTDALENRYYDRHLELAFHSQLKRIQPIGESPQEFVAVIDHQAQGVHIELPKYLINKDAARASTYRRRERAVRRQLLLGARRHPVRPQSDR
jgi:hypothetical protein